MLTDEQVMKRIDAYDRAIEKEAKAIYNALVNGSRINIEAFIETIERIKAYRSAQKAYADVLYENANISAYLSTRG